MFYDQIWANYIPVMFNNYLILKHYGYNVANWNWHERTLTKSGGEWMVNEKYPLTFFHFSSYRYSAPLVLCNYNTRYNRFNRPDIAEVVDEYYADLKAAGAMRYGKARLITRHNTVYELKMLAARPLKEKVRNRLSKMVEKYFSSYGKMPLNKNVCNYPGAQAGNFGRRGDIFAGLQNTFKRVRLLFDLSRRDGYKRVYHGIAHRFIITPG
jgi:hypothetical protein